MLCAILAADAGCHSRGLGDGVGAIRQQCEQALLLFVWVTTGSGHVAFDEGIQIGAIDEPPASPVPREDHVRGSDVALADVGTDRSI
jgi:hypothetical protein